MRLHRHLPIRDQDAALALRQAEAGDSIRSDALKVATATWIDRSVRLLPAFDGR